MVGYSSTSMYIDEYEFVSKVERPKVSKSEKLSTYAKAKNPMVRNDKKLQRGF